MSVEVVAAAQRPSHLAAGAGVKPPKHDAVVVTVRACESLAASAPYLKVYLSKNGVDVKRTKTKGDYGAKGSHKLPLPTMLEVDIPSALAVGSCLNVGFLLMLLRDATQSHRRRPFPPFCSPTLAHHAYSCPSGITPA
jgi:hypothetical protein